MSMLETNNNIIYNENIKISIRNLYSKAEGYGAGK